MAMGGLSQLLDVARRAMMSQRIGMDVTSHNIANASTPGYSRQRADFVATMPMQTSFGMLGTGVTVQHIGRIRNSFIDQQVRVSNDAFGKGNSQLQTLSQIEALINEPSDSGLAATMTNFFKSFQDLAVHPEEASTRNAVLQQGVLLVQSFHGLNSRITEIRGGIVDDVNTKVSRINTLAGELSALDINISNDIAMGVDPSDLKDQRDLKLDELSQLVNINVSEDKSGSIMVSVGGTLIASRAGAVPLKATMAGNQINVVSSLSGLQLNVTGGELGGALNMSNTTLPG
jgi:flagellar hook-associated protein 1 FlgK